MRFPILAGAALLLSTAALAQTPPTAMPTPPAATDVPAQASRMHTLTLRLRPGQDLRQQLTALVQQRQLKAAAVLTCVGSLTQVTLRLANQEGPTVYHGHFEIVSLVGTLADSGSHLHLAVADSTGRTIGGHLLDGNLVYTTAELVLGVLEDVEFRRETDPAFGYKELAVHPASATPAKPAKRPGKGKK
jgi:predicted DNA-binding protein with PD1-like motif